MDVWNAQSMKNKINDICDFIESEELDAFALTKPWLKGVARDDHVIAAFWTLSLAANSIPFLALASMARKVVVELRTVVEEVLKCHNTSFEI